MLPGLYQETKAKVTQSLKEIEHIVINADGWTSGATQSCITVKAHAVTNNWEIRMFCSSDQAPHHSRGVKLKTNSTKLITAVIMDSV